MEGYDTRREAELFGSYLLSATPAETATQAYVQAIAAQPGVFSPKDIRLLTFVHKHRRLIGLVDAGLQVVDPQSEVRRRMYIMFAILEATPQHHKQFLSQPRSFWYVFAVAWYALLGFSKAALGVMLVKVVGR